MSKTLSSLLAATAASAALFTASAFADDAYDRRERGWGGGDRGLVLELYSEPGFRGRSITLRPGDDADMNTWGFNDQARSARVRGVWDACQHSGFGGRCIVLRQDEPDLARLGFANQISAARPSPNQWAANDPRWGDDRWGGGWQNPGGSYGGGWGRPNRPDAEGRSAAFFRQPLLDGRPIPADGRGADAFCRSAGFRGAAYSTSARIRGGAILEDVLCVR